MYHAQATEIQDSTIAARPTSSCEKLKSWRDVALQKLKSIHWQPTCAYETTVFPDKDTMAKQRRDAIKTNEEKPLKETRKDALELYTLTHITQGVAMAVTCV